MLEMEADFARRAAALAQSQDEALAADEDWVPRTMREPSGRSALTVVYMAGLLVMLWAGLQLV